MSRRTHGRACRAVVAAAGVAATLLLAPGPPAGAGGPFLVNGFGEPLLWDTDVPLVFNLDQGPLGQLEPDAAAALARGAFGVWESVPTSAVRFEAGPPLPCDVTVDTVFACGPDGEPVFGNGADGLSPYVFDTDGRILDLLFGIGARNDVIGVAVVGDGTYIPPRALEGEALVNGRFFDGVDMPGNPESDGVEAFQAVMIHEIGHWLNLDHAQVNLHVWLDGDPDNEAVLPTMFPASTDDDAELASLAPDDVATLSTLYPQDRRDRRAPERGGWHLGQIDGVHPVPGAIRGSVLASDGVTPFRGANLVLRRVDDPQGHAYTTTSGARFRPNPPPGVPVSEYGGPPDPALAGAFDLGGLPPGSYTLEIEEINPLFLGASSVGSRVVPVVVPGPNEFWNGAAEAADPAIDDPADRTRIGVAAGRELSGIDIILNEPPPPAVLWVVDDELFAPRDLLRRAAILELDLATGAVLNRIPTAGRSSMLSDGLAFAPSRGTLFWTDGLGEPSIFEIDPADGTVLAELPWPAGVQSIDGLAWLEGPGQPPGGLLYAQENRLALVLALDPDTGDIVPDLSLGFGSTLFGGLAGAGDDLFVTTFGAAILHVRPAQENPFVQALPKPELEQFLQGLAYDGRYLYATSIIPPEFRVWQIDPFPATDPASRLGGDLDVLQAVPDPTPVIFGGFSAAAMRRRADVDGDLQVDGEDLALLSRSLSSVAGETGYSARADLDGDGRIGTRDLFLLTSRFGRAGERGRD